MPNFGKSASVISQVMFLNPTSKLLNVTSEPESTYMTVCDFIPCQDVSETVGAMVTLLSFASPIV